MWLLVLLAGFGLLIGAVTAEQRKAARLKSAEDGGDDDKCWLCGHTELEPIAELTYRCRACGGVQGEKAAALKEAARRALFAKLSVAERRSQAELLLSEAKLELIALDDGMQQVLELSAVDLQEEGDGGEEKLSRFGQLLLDVGKLEQKLIDVAVVLATPEQLQRLAIDLPSMNALLDKLELRVSWQTPLSSGSMALSGADSRTHQDISRASSHLVELHAMYDHMCARLASFEAERSSAPV